LFKVKEGEDLNHRNTRSILRIAPVASLRAKLEPDTDIGEKGAFLKGLEQNFSWQYSSK
jgi:hypothetical protein